MQTFSANQYEDLANQHLAQAAEKPGIPAAQVHATIGAGYAQLAAAYRAAEQADWLKALVSVVESRP